jgi:tetratricopeptide (TPR) repeat protein
MLGADRVNNKVEFGHSRLMRAILRARLGSGRLLRGCALVAGALWGPPAFPQTQPDLWQTYMRAASLAEEIDDFEISAILLRNARVLARTYGALSERPELSRLLLMLTYLELREDDPLWKSVRDEGPLKIDVSQFDPSLADFASALDGFGSNYYNRWKKRSLEKNISGLKRVAPLYGAKNCYAVESAIRQKLTPAADEQIANTLGLQALATWRSDGMTEPADELFDKAIDRFGKALRQHNSMSRGSDFFRVGASRSSQGVPWLSENLISVMIESAIAHIDAARDNLEKKKFQEFDANVKKAEKLDTQLEQASGNMTASWPSHPFFGLLHREFGILRFVQFDRAKADPSYDNASRLKAEAKKEFEAALANFEYSKGHKSDDAKGVASWYVEFLHSAGETAEAKQIEERYGIMAQ